MNSKNKKLSSSSLNPKINRFYSKFRKELPPADIFVEEILKGNKVFLSRAITLIESTSPEHKKLAAEIIRKTLPYAGKSFRLGITGVPGVGKSTFIDRLGMEFIKQGRHVAVLAIDPSSALNKGSILGDKTRMEKLSRSERAFIRPSPAGNHLGGVGRKTRESIILCEAAGFDRIIVETVGVGQSEVYVHSMTDIFLLLKLPGAGDELQGIKRGVMEMADMILINKADGEMQREAEKAVRIFKNALRYFTFRPADSIEVLAFSSLTGNGMDKVLGLLEKKYTQLKESGELDQKRSEQLHFWFDERLSELFGNFLIENKQLSHKKKELNELVKQKKITPFEAAEKFWNDFLESLKL